MIMTRYSDKRLFLGLQVLLLTGAFISINSGRFYLLGHLCLAINVLNFVESPMVVDSL